MSCTALQHLDDIEKVFPRIKPLLISASHSRIPLTQSSVYIPWTLPYWCHLLFSPFITHVFCRATWSCLKVLPCNLIQYKLPPEANEKNGSFFFTMKKHSMCLLQSRMEFIFLSTCNNATRVRKKNETQNIIFCLKLKILNYVLEFFKYLFKKCIGNQLHYYCY